jgi:hypothetical protein
MIQRLKPGQSHGQTMSARSQAWRIGLKPALRRVHSTQPKKTKKKESKILQNEATKSNRINKSV